MEFVLATHNRDKVREIRSILSGLDAKIVSLDEYPGAPDVVEDGETLKDNALLKARAIREFTGRSSLADDSGLEVDALEGAPGVFSSRYAGEDVTYKENNQKLLNELEQVPDDERTAQFKCVMALALTEDLGVTLYQYLKERNDKMGISHCLDGERVDALVTVGMVPGRIAHSIRGREGFGYDPLFEIPHLGKTFAEIGLDEKNRMSHRYRALVEIRSLIVQYKLAKETPTTP